MKLSFSTLFSRFSRHFYAVAAIAIAAFSQHFLFLLILVSIYLADLLSNRKPPATTDDNVLVVESIEPAPDSFYAPTAIDTEPFVNVLSDDTPSIYDCSLPDSTTEEQLPIHNLELLQAYAQTPADSKLTVQDAGADPWLRAFQSMHTAEAPPAHSLLSHSTVEADDPSASPVAPDSSSEDNRIPLVIVDDSEERE